MVFSGKSYTQEISQDALILTIRAQEQISLDSTLASKVGSALFAARETTSEITGIHAFKDFVYDQILISTEASWNQPWRDGNIITGENYIDSLGMVFNLNSVNLSGIYNEYFSLSFSFPLKTPLLAELYEKQEDIIWASANGYGGDGDNIEMLQVRDSLLFAFSIGIGDCPSGCIYRYYWYISVYKTDVIYTGILHEERERDLGIPYIYRWNIPARYAITMFSSIDSILSEINNSEVWWIKRHCIESLWRLYIWDYPWVGEDLENQSIWDSLKSETFLKYDEVVSTLQHATNDSIQFVRESAIYALDKIKTITSIEKNILQKSEIVISNYPNPFNSNTVINYAIPNQSLVELKVFDVLGKEVATLVNKEQSAGSYQVQFTSNNLQLTSGVYFYQLRAAPSSSSGHVFIESRKMILLK